MDAKIPDSAPSRESRRARCAIGRGQAESTDARVNQKATQPTFPLMATLRKRRQSSAHRRVPPDRCSAGRFRREASAPCRIARDRGRRTWPSARGTAGESPNWAGADAGKGTHRQSVLFPAARCSRCGWRSHGAHRRKRPAIQAESPSGARRRGETARLGRSAPRR